MRVIFADLPTAVHEMLTVDAEGFYTIMLNLRDSVEDRMNHYYHAIKHIHGNDFEKFEAQKIEKECHSKRCGTRIDSKWWGDLYGCD